MDDTAYGLDEEQQAAKPKRPGLPVEPRRILGILAEHRKELVLAFVGTAVLALIAFFFVPRTYESSSHVLYEGTPLLDADPEKGELSAFLDTVLSSSRLREVREQLGWDHSLKALEAQLKVTQESESSMRIVAKAGTAEDAQALAQTVLDVFLARQASFNANRLETLRAETEVALVHAKERRTEAAKAFESFQQESGKPDLLQDQARLLERVATLRSKADEAAVEAAAQRAQIEELQKAQQELPRQVMGSATVGTPVDAPLATARSELATARATLSEEHPRVQALQQRVNSLQRQRQSQPNERGQQTMVSNPARDAVEKELATARAALAAAEEREAALRVLIKSVKAEADALAPAEGQARQVVQALAVAEQRLQYLDERATRLQDAAVGSMTGFRVLSAPPLPEESRRSKTSVLLLLLLPILVVFIVALVLLARRLQALAVEAPREVAWWGNGPVLGTSVWPRDPDALDFFVDELEDHGVHGVGRTLVVPATETERDIACAFAIRLSKAPWLAAAILDVEERPPDVDTRSLRTPLARTPRLTPSATAVPRQLSSQNTPRVPPGRAIKTPKPPARPTIQGLSAPTSESTPTSKSKWSSAPPPPAKSDRAPKDVTEQEKSSSSRPPRKKTIVGFPAVRGSGSSQPPPATARQTTPRSVRGVTRATVRMVIQPSDLDRSTGAFESRDAGNADEEAFLLTRPVATAGASIPPESHRDAPASHAVMRAAVRLLGNGSDEATGLRPSDPPSVPAVGETTAVALAWNGPLSGPILRRAARLAHRVLVVVSSGMNVIELTRVTTRLGREDGVGYVLVNLKDAYVDLDDRVGDVEAFWGALQQGDRPESRAS
ncbi:MAG: hypothetical protein OES69_12790 [Myxococcales bacterium]|nr:hypothetical protein [Myxococcales bacterium]MDH3844812.1 hypothetical protein [Myxococcales bacterium]